MSDDEDNIYQSPINSLHSNAFDPGQLDYRQLIALNGRQRFSENRRGHGIFDYSRYKQFYKGGADPVESRSSAQDQALEDEIALFTNIPDEDIGPESLTIPNETVPIDKNIVFDEIQQMFTSLTGKSLVSQQARSTIFEIGKIQNQTRFLLQGINGRMKSTFNVERNYTFDEFSEFILGVNFGELTERLTSEINNVYESMDKRASAASKVTKTNLIYIMLSIVGPLDAGDRNQVSASNDYYDLARFNSSFTILKLAANAPKAVNVYGDPKTNKAETDTSAVDDNIQNTVKTDNIMPVVPDILQQNMTMNDRIRMILEEVNNKSEDYINLALKNDATFMNLRKDYINTIMPIMFKNIEEAEKLPEGKRYEYYDIDKKITSTKTAKGKNKDPRVTVDTSLRAILKAKGAVKALINKTLIKTKNPIGRPPINTRIDDNIDPETTKAVLEKVDAEREKQMEEAKKVEEDLKANPPAVPYEGLKPIKLESKKLDMSKFSAIAAILSPAVKDKALERNTEAMAKLSGDKQDAKAALELLFANRQPLKQASPEIEKVFKIPKAPPLTMPQLQQATQATSSKAAALSTSSGYQQTPKDSLITTMTVIKLLQPIVKDSDVQTRLAAAEALLMAKAYDNNSMNAIDNYLKRAIDDKLNVLKGYSSAYTNAESDLLEAMKQVLDNKNNPDNPSKLFRYSTYMKSNKSVPIKTKLSSDKINYLKSIDLGVKSLNLKKATKKAEPKTPVKKVTKKAEPKTKAVTKKLVKTNIQKQKDRNVKIRAAMAKLRSRQSPEGDNTEVQSEAYINKLSSEAKIEAERLKGTIRDVHSKQQASSE